MNKIAVLLILLFAIAVQGNSQSSDEIQSKSVLIHKMLSNFYIEYISEQDKWPTDYKRIDFILKQYCTKGVISKKKKTDYDIFLNAQDIADGLLKSMEIKQSDFNENVFIVSFLDKPDPVKLLIKEYKGKYKIADVL